MSDAKGQRQSITYGNGTATAYTYDPLTFRLSRLVTTRTSPAATLQDLSYTYDPIGNITEIVDAAQQTVFFDNTAAPPSMAYTYDAVYRLTTATGREHAGLIGDDQRDERDLPIHALPHANDMSAVRRYEETYTYDAIGNFVSLAHVAVGNSAATWTRRYDYYPGTNRLRSTSLPGDTTAPYSATYPHDAHGNITSMPHLSAIDWDPLDQMQRADLGGGGEVFFTYDGAGQRVRKYRKHIGTLVEERIYLGSFEIYRKRNGSTLQVERETLHVMDGVRRVAMIETKTVDTAVVGLVPTPRYRFQLGNHLETAHLEVDDTGLVISYEEMHPYGTSAYRSANGAVEVSARRYRYTGKERDDETGLDYFGARYYASWLGRWVSADPLGAQAGINLYLYCRAGPVVFRDPDGRDALPAEGSVDRQIALQKDPQLIRSLKGMSAEQRGSFLQGATGRFAERANAAARGLERVYTLPESTVTGRSLEAERQEIISKSLAPLDRTLPQVGPSEETKARAHEQVRWVGFGEDPREAKWATAGQILANEVLEDVDPTWSDAREVLRHTTAHAVQKAMGVAGKPGVDDVDGSAKPPAGSPAKAPGTKQSNSTEGAGAWAADKPFFNTNPKSVPTFGHTFLTHGEGPKLTRNLTGEAKGTGQAQGQWLNNEAAAQFLAGERPYITGPTTVPLPPGLGQVIQPDGTIVPATRAILVPRGDAYRTAYPIY